MKKVISIVLNNFKNDSRVLKECISLQKGGYDVQVVALYDEGQKEFEKIQNISVERIKLNSRGWSKRRVVQLFKYLEFTYRAVKRYRGVDIVHCNDLNALPIGVMIKFFNKDVKIVYDAHEYETEINGLRGVLKIATKFLEKSLIRYANRVITVSDAIADEYVKLYNIQKPALVLNTPVLQSVEKMDIFREEFGISKMHTIFLYQGSLSPGRGVELILDTFKKIDEERQRVKREANNSPLPCIIFMGYGPLEEAIQEHANNYNNIFFHEAVSPDILLNYTSSADFGISLIEDSCLSYRYCLPNKMFEYMMAEIPVIVSNLPQMKQFVEENDVGVVVKENTILGFKKSIQEALMLDKKRVLSNIKKVREYYNWSKQEKVLLELYRELDDA